MLPTGHDSLQEKVHNERRSKVTIKKVCEINIVSNRILVLNFNLIFKHNYEYRSHVR